MGNGCFYCFQHLLCFVPAQPLTFHDNSRRTLARVCESVFGFASQLYIDRGTAFFPLTNDIIRRGGRRRGEAPRRGAKILLN